MAAKRKSSKGKDAPKVSIESQADGPRTISYSGIDYVIPAGKSSLEAVEGSGHDPAKVARHAARMLGSKDGKPVLTVKVSSGEGDDEKSADEHLLDHIENMGPLVRQPLRKPNAVDTYGEEVVEQQQLTWAKEERARHLGLPSEHADQYDTKDLMETGSGARKKLGITAPAAATKPAPVAEKAPHPVHPKAEKPDAPAASQTIKAEKGEGAPRRIRESKKKPK